MRLLTILLIFFIPGVVAAYLDPGSISYFVQMLVAILAGVGVAIKMFWSSIKRAFVRLFQRGSKNSKEEEKKNDQTIAR